MTGDMAVQTSPVGIVLGLLRQSGLCPERGEEAVHVVLEQNLQIEVAGMLERAVQQLHVPYRELVVI